MKFALTRRAWVVDSKWPNTLARGAIDVHLGDLMSMEDVGDLVHVVRN